KAGLACVRDTAGSYSDVDLQAELEQAFGLASERPPLLLAWFPSADGAFGFVNSPSPAFLNPRSKTVVKIAEELWDPLRQVMPAPRAGQVTTTVLATPSEPVVLRGYDGYANQFAITFDG